MDYEPMNEAPIRHYVAAKLSGKETVCFGCGMSTEEITRPNHWFYVHNEGVEIVKKFIADPSSCRHHEFKVCNAVMTE